MAISDAYATAAQYRAVIEKTSTSDDAQILIDLKAMTRYIELKLGTFFNVDAADTTRVFLLDPSNSVLHVGALSVAPTSIKIDTNNDGSFADETALAVTDYELLPLDAALLPEVHPFTSISLLPWGANPTWGGGKRVQVVGKFGWPAVPEGIRAACIELTALLRLETPRATRRISELDGTIETSFQAQSIIQKLMDQYQVKFFA